MLGIGFNNALAQTSSGLKAKPILIVLMSGSLIIFKLLLAIKESGPKPPLGEAPLIYDIKFKQEKELDAA